MEAVTYPYALNERGERVGVGAPSGVPYRCIGCGGAMAARTRDFDGRQRPKHFAHRGQTDCTRDLILHTDTQRLVVESFNAKVADGLPYEVGAVCNDCLGTLWKKNMAVEGAVAIPERSVIPGTRSDVVILWQGTPQMIIEVVNTRGLSEDTERAYKGSGIPVVLVKIGGLQEPPPEIAERIIVSKQDCVPPAQCDRCHRALVNRWYPQQAWPSTYVPSRVGTSTCVNCGHDMRHPRPDGCILHSPWPSDRGATRCTHCGHFDTWHTYPGGGCGLCVAHHGQPVGVPYSQACMG